MKKENLVFAVIVLCFLSSLASARLACMFCRWWYCTMNECLYWDGTYGECYPTTSWRLLKWRCVSCPPPWKAHCADYDIKEICLKDPCKASGIIGCKWEPTVGYCHAGCGGRSEGECRGKKDNKTGCLPDYKKGSFYRCIDCPMDMDCTKYKNSKDCDINPCKVAGACIWWGSHCVSDADSDGCPDTEDNCPGKKNMDPSSRNMPNSFCDAPSVCDWEGDACDDTDGDGLTDEFEMKTPGLDPRNTDANKNCIPDGVEYAFDPLIKVLKKVAVAVATVMIAYVGVGWLTADTPAKRDNAKKAVIYIIAGLIILAGGRDLVVYLFQGECARPPDIGYACSCSKECPTAPTGGDSSPFIYSFNGKRFTLEHDGYPFAVLPPWEYETYSRLTNLAEVSGLYHLRLAEELEYTTYTNRLRLFVVDHGKGVSVYPDFYGELHTIGNPVKPTSCVEEDGTDCTAFMEEDDVYWRSSTDDKNLSDSDGDDVVDVYDPEDLFDGIILSFPNPTKAGHAKLLFKARETGGISVAWHSLLEVLGREEVEKLVSASGREPLKSLLSSLKNKNALYNVRVWDGEKWVLQGSFGLGVVTPSEFIVPLDVPEEEVVRIKLDSAILAYETDYALLDYTPDENISVVELNPHQVESHSLIHDEEALNMLAYDDDIYLPLSTGEYVDVYFKPPKASYGERTVVVGVKGYYLAHVSSPSEWSLKSIETVANFILDPTYAIRYTYPKYLMSEWVE